MKLNKTSKRQGLHQKHKVLKKIKESHRDLRKKLKNKSKKNHAKPEMIPTEVPFRKEIMEEINASKEMQKEAEKKRLMHLWDMKKKGETTNDKIVNTRKDVSMAFANDIKKVIDMSDVIVEVLDARDPQGTRSIETEQDILNANKKLVILLNKIDLVPLENMISWMKYLSQFAMVVPFKASTQKQADKLGVKRSHNIPSVGSKNTSSAYGVDRLLSHIKSLVKPSAADSNKIRTTLKIGVIGMPNTGKSSVINSMKRKRICEAGNMAGLTRHLQEIALDANINLIDSPGIVLARSEDEKEYALKNCTRLEMLVDPESVAYEVFKRCGASHLYALYKLRLEQADSDENMYQMFMIQFAGRFCAMKKGGIVNIRAAAIRLLTDWNCGKIFYTTEAPAMEASVDTKLTPADLSALTEVSRKVEIIDAVMQE